MADPIKSTLLQALPLWTKFSLDTRRPNLDALASTTKDNTKSSQERRKKLAEATKQFKKSVKNAESTLTTIASASNTDDNDDNETNNSRKKVMEILGKECRNIVKAYQEEIDQLTRRCKFSEGNFFDLFKALYELPDPVPMLTSANEHLDAKVGQVNHLLKGMGEIQNEMEEHGTRYEGQLQEKKCELESMRLKLEEERKRYKELEKLHERGRNDQKEKDRQMKTGGLSKAEREELISLRSEVTEYELEFKTLKNQDITIKKLNTKIETLVENQEEELQRELQTAQEHLAQTEGRRATEALEREATLERKLASLELELRAERAGREATQNHLLQADEGLGECEAAWEAQRQILVDDADRLRESVFDLKRERDELNLRVSALMDDDGDDGERKNRAATAGGDLSSTMSQADHVLERKAYEAEVNELSVSITSLREEIKTKDETTFELQRSMQATAESLENERSFLTNKVTALESQIANAPSKEMVDNLRRELRILKKLEYNAVDIDAEKEPEMTSSPSGDEKDDLETILIGKLRKVEADLVKERREKSDQLLDCKQLNEKIIGLEKAKLDADALALRLEADLEKAIVASPNILEGRMSSDSHVPINAASHDPATLQRILDPSAPVPVTPAPASPTANSTTERNNDDHSVATIVMAQRDRLRARCDAMEAERDSFKRELQVQVSTAESLKVDNTKLYEKVRYLQNYNNKNGGLSSRHQSNTLVDRDLDLEALEQRYEASVDPFRQFNRAEKQRKLKEMSPMERTVFVVAKTVLGSKGMRTALFFYVLGMHLLVFTTTYHWSHGCNSTYPTFENHPDHLAHFHGGVPDSETGA